ncbi:transcription factor GAMYB-like [Tripterygium wilfordii]|uniref:Transcription factor GAMYB-like n=1 Tax=Tripterygium wilfordii TaxID=458696 RepID=A0A7J7DZ26_TRIWF|nr:transcription factor GAMYB-like isoform X2 [Tripterygium wilfordii]XP_038682719.1 transcription factor GAMYB-like isoform X2 [Tripterygium wilfordii]KAF5751640.1 transcription factor GAMYB-like [Tripterygium wilfordii]
MTSFFKLNIHCPIFLSFFELVFIVLLKSYLLQFPGRTDNEIKNFWNTRIKRLQRAGLPIYPADVSLQLLNGNQEGQNMGRLTVGDSHDPDLIQADNLEIPDVRFKNLELNQSLLSYSPTLLDFPAGNVLKQSVGSSHSYSFMLPTLHPRKRLRESEALFPVLEGSFSGGPPLYNQYVDYDSEKIADPFHSSSSYDPGFETWDQMPLDAFSGSHALLNGISSSSEPTCGATKLELPSLQYSETQQDSWGTPASPLPSLESVDTLIQSPPTEKTKSECISARSSGMLEAVLYQSQTLKSSTMSSHQQNSVIYDFPGDVVDDSPMNPGKTVWEARHDPNSSLGHSAASIFSENTPVDGSSLDEPHSIENMPGCNIEKKEAPSQIDLSRPDLLLGSGLFGHWGGHVKNQSLPTDPVEALLGEDVGSYD